VGEQLVGLDRACEPADQGGTVLQPGAGEQNLARVGVRRPGLGMQVVAVVPDRHEAEVGHRCEGRGARADDDAARPA
jgi:hypothetical protein